MMKRVPQFLTLTPADCRKVLARNHVGRLAFMVGRAVDIEPLGYVFDGDWMFMRSAYGTKIAALARKPYVAFEVDEVKGMFDWRSVVVHGTIYQLPDAGAPVQRRVFARALAALRRVVPEALTADDPTPERQIVYGLNIHRLDGRMARWRPARSR